MNKEEILAKSRLEQKDEGLTAAQNHGRKIGWCAFALIFVFIIIFNALHGEPSYAARSMFWAFIAAESLPLYKFTKKKTYLVTVIAGSFASIFSLLTMVMLTLR